MFLFRWALTLTILILLYDKPSFQIISLLILSVIWQNLILFSKPFETKALNIISFYNELAVSLYLYIAFVLTDFLETQVSKEEEIAHLRLILAWILSGILALTILINFIFAFVHIISSVFTFLKRKITCKK